MAKSFLLLTLLAILGFCVVGLHLVEANCGDPNHDFWKDGAGEGTCSQTSADKDLNDLLKPTIDHGNDEDGVGNTQVQPSFMDSLKNVLNMLWVFVKWYFNLN